MFTLPAIMQLPLGLALGAASVVAPGLLRPFIIVALVVAAFEATLIYHSGGTGALQVALGWVLTLFRDASLILIGIGLGRVAADILAR